MERTERAKGRTRKARAKAKAGTRAARPAQAQARASAQLARVHFVRISDIIIVHVRPVWVSKGQVRRRKRTQPRVEEIGQKGAKANLARAKAKGSSERKACTESMKEMRPSGSHRPSGSRKDGLKKNTPEQYMMNMMR